METSKSGLQSRNPLQLLQLAWYINPEKVKYEFGKVEVDIQKEEDLITLSKLHENKLDISGAVKDVDNNPVMFDVIRVVNSIKYNKQEELKLRNFLNSLK